MVRWWWFGAAVEKPEIFRELQEMKADGIGGAELAFVYPQVLDSPSPADPAKSIKNLPFLSPEFLDAVRFAQSEGRKLGLRIDVTLASGWPYGGPAITLAQAAGRLRVAELPIPPDTTTLPQLKLADGESIISISVVNGEPGHWNATPSQTFPKSDAPIPAATVPRVALVFISSHTGQQVKRAAVGAEGFVLDPFSRDAVATHLQSVGEPLLKAFGDSPPYAVFSDSLEAYGADWTPNLPAEFLKRRGYDLLPHLPELVAGGTPAADAVRHDWGRTLTDLVNENYLTQINNWAIDHHTRFRSQTYGEPAVSFSSQNLASLAEGEGPQWRAFSTLRWATSANHVFNNNVTSGETFTWLHSPVFRATPLDMKAEADIDFIMGENQLIFHGWPYSPPESRLAPGDPGWSLYAAAVFNDHNPWHPVMPAVTRYIQRISWLLRQGQPGNQVAILLPTDDAWAGFTPAHVTVTGAMQKLVPKEIIAAILSAGYNFDFIDADAINSVGIHYAIVVLPPTDRIPADTLARIATYVKGGGKAISVGRPPSLDPNSKPSPEITTLSKQLFTPINSTLVPSHLDLPDALHHAAPPDLKLAASRDAVGFIRRKLDDSDVYFVTNTSNQPVDTTATFASPFESGERWDPDTGLATPAFPQSQPIHLAPYESAVFVFSNTPSKAEPIVPPTKLLADLTPNWKVTFLDSGRSRNDQFLADWTADPATLHYSGAAVYARDFTLPPGSAGTPLYLEIDGGKPLPGSPDSPPEHAVLGANGLPDPRVTRTGPGMHAFYAPPIRDAARVTINGQPAGALWHPPYRLDITSLLKSGANHIEIRVFNTALNAWSALPPRDYAPLIAKYGDRFQMQDLDQVKPLPSGILGPIHLTTPDTR